MIRNLFAIQICIVDTAGSVKDVLCWWVKILGPVLSRVVFFMILAVLFLIFLSVSSRVYCGYLVTQGVAVFITRSAPLVLLSAWSVMLGRVLFWYGRHFLHLWICLLPLLVLTPFWVLFFPILQRGLNGEGQMQRYLLLAHRRCFLLSFFIILHRCIYERNVSPLFCIQDLTSSIDVGRLYVDRKFLVNCSSSSPQLPMESSGSLLNQDRVAPVRCRCKLCIVVALDPPSICTA
jgi:hypothetical protein